LCYNGESPPFIGEGFFPLNEKIMKENIVKIQMNKSYPYSDFDGWYKSLPAEDREVWVSLAQNSMRSENNAELLTKKAMELYCLEMGIDYIPKSEDYLEIIYKRLVTNLSIASMIDRGLVVIGSGKLSFLTKADIVMTDLGKNYMKSKIVA
jgi:hypothetical protein